MFLWVGVAIFIQQFALPWKTKLHVSCPLNVSLIISHVCQRNSFATNLPNTASFAMHRVFVSVILLYVACKFCVIEGDWSNYMNVDGCFLGIPAYFIWQHFLIKKINQEKYNHLEVSIVILMEALCNLE